MHFAFVLGSILRIKGWKILCDFNFISLWPCDFNLNLIVTSSVGARQQGTKKFLSTIDAIVQQS